MAHVLESKTSTIHSADGTIIWAASAGRPASEAPTIVFVPGFGCASLAFTKQFEDERLLAKYCLITYEPRGQGRSGQPLEIEAYSSQRNAEDFKAVCNAFGAKKVILAGWSYGGLIPCDVFAHLGPEWISGVIYLAGVPWRSMHPEIAHPDVLAVVGPLVEADTTSLGPWSSKFIDSCFYPPNLDSLSLLHHSTLAWFVAQQHPEARKLLLTVREQDPSKLLEHSPTLPVLLIMGEYDRHMYWDKVDAFVKKHFAKSSFLLVKDAGHATFWEKPEEVNAAIVDFVSSI